VVQETLRQIHHWYTEPTDGNDRPKLLSKLAVLELCGWLEGEFDRLIREIDKGCLKDQAWADDIIKKTNGFRYDEHFRPMIVRFLGEHITRIFEKKMEQDYPGELERLKSMLGTLWLQRCSFAHGSMIANVAAQQTFYAPSWVQNQHRIISKIVEKVESALLDTVSNL
jgi:hypothetical protein